MNLDGIDVFGYFLAYFGVGAKYFCLVIAERHVGVVRIETGIHRADIRRVFRIDEFTVYKVIKHTVVGKYRQVKLVGLSAVFRIGNSVRNVGGDGDIRGVIGVRPDRQGGERVVCKHVVAQLYRKGAVVDVVGVHQQSRSAHSVDRIDGNAGGEHKSVGVQFAEERGLDKFSVDRFVVGDEDFVIRAGIFHFPAVGLAESAFVRTHFCRGIVGVDISVGVKRVVLGGTGRSVYEGQCEQIVGRSGTHRPIVLGQHADGLGHFVKAQLLPRDISFHEEAFAAAELVERAFITRTHVYRHVGGGRVVYVYAQVKIAARNQELHIRIVEEIVTSVPEKVTVVRLRGDVQTSLAQMRRNAEFEVGVGYVVIGVPLFVLPDIFVEVTVDNDFVEVGRFAVSRIVGLVVLAVVIDKIVDDNVFVGHKRFARGCSPALIAAARDDGQQANDGQYGYKHYFKNFFHNLLPPLTR